MNIRYKICTILLVTALVIGSSVLAEDVTYKGMEFTDTGDEYIVNLSEYQIDDSDEVQLYIFREDPEGIGYYNYMIRGREVEPDEQGIAHISKSQEIIGVWDKEEDVKIAVPWQFEQQDNGMYWTTHNFYLLYDSNCNFFSENNSTFLTIKEDSGVLSYTYEIEEEKYQDLQIAHTGCFGQGYKVPGYTEDGVLMDFPSWESGINVVEKYSTDNTKTDIPFRKMNISDFPEETYACQLLVTKSDGNYLTTDFMLLQEGCVKENDVEYQIETDNGRMVFSVTDGMAILTDYEGEDKKITIPAYIEGYKVTAIDRYALCYSDAEEITIPETVETFGEINSKSLLANDVGYFSNCQSLKKITIVDNNPNFQMIDNALYSKDGKKLYAVINTSEDTFEIPDGVEEIGTLAFANAGIRRVIFPDTLLKIEEFAFLNVELEELVLPEQLRKIGTGAFSSDVFHMGWKEVHSITVSKIKVAIGKSVEYIAPEAFSGLCIKEYLVDGENKYYTSLEGMLLTKDAKYLLAFPTGIGGKVTLPEGIEKVENAAFSGNGAFYQFGDEYTGITELTLPSTMRYFYATIVPESLKHLYKNNGLEFINESGLTYLCYDLIIHEAESNNSEEAEGYLSSDQKTLEAYSSVNTQLSYTIPDTVTKIKKNGFHSDYLRKLIFPKDLCLSEMSSYELPETLGNLPLLEEIEVEEGNENYCSVDGVLYTKDMSILIYYPKGKTDKDFTIPEGVNTIQAIAFDYRHQENDNIENVYIPSTLEKLKSNEDVKVFLGNLRNLKSLSVSEESPYYFYTDGMLISKRNHAMIYNLDIQAKEIIIPEGVEKIAKEVFFYVRNYDAEDPWAQPCIIEVPETLCEIEGRAFSNPGVKLRVHKGTFGETYAIENQFEYEVIE